MNNSFIKTVEENVNGRDFVIGDLHGCYDELMSLLKYVSFDRTKDRLFSTGDLIDRGPKPKECLSLLKEKWFFSVFGNHEEIICNKISNPYNIAREEIDYVKMVANFENKLKELPFIYEIRHLLHNNVYILHSEILPEHLYRFEDDDIGSQEYIIYLNIMKKFDISKNIKNFIEFHKTHELSSNLKKKLIWSRKIISNFYKENKNNIEKNDFSFVNINKNQKIKIFSGHNVVPFPIKIGQQYYIDTGAALGYSNKGVNSYLFSQFGHEYFALSMVDIGSGECFACISSETERGKIVKLKDALY